MSFTKSFGFYRLTLAPLPTVISPTNLLNFSIALLLSSTRYPTKKRGFKPPSPRKLPFGYGFFRAVNTPPEADVVGIDVTPLPMYPKFLTSRRLIGLQLQGGSLTD
jgi:hypothetical protein